MKIKILFGVGIAVVIAMANSFFLDLFGIKYEFVRTYAGFAPLVIIAIGLFIGIKKIKAEQYNNEINFGQAIFSGITITLTTALCLAIINFFYFQYINTNYAEEVLSIAIPEMQKNNMDAKEIAKQIATTKENYLPANQLKGTFVFIMVCGIAFSAILSSLLRTRETFTEITKKKE